MTKIAGRNIIIMIMAAVLSNSRYQRSMVSAWCHHCQRSSVSLRLRSSFRSSSFQSFSTSSSIRRRPRRLELCHRRSPAVSSFLVKPSFRRFASPTTSSLEVTLTSSENTSLSTQQSLSTQLSQMDVDDDDDVDEFLSTSSDASSPVPFIQFTDDWRQRPEVNPTFSFPTWLIPKAYSQTILHMKQAQQHLASRMGMYQDLHPRLPVIRKYNDTHNCILLRSCCCDDDTDNTDHDNQGQNRVQNHQRDDALRQIQEQDIPITVGPTLEITIPYSQWSVSFLLQQLLPPSVHPIPTAFETVGHIAHFNLKPHHMPYGKLIGQVVLECLQPTISMVITKDGTVQGPHRTYSMQVLATSSTTTTTKGEADAIDTRVTVQESGLSLSLDLATCYWNSRLWQERQELLTSILRHTTTATTTTTSPHHENHQRLWMVDAFCGVGALSLLLAKQYPTCRMWCNDWNPHAIGFLKENAKRNQIDLERIDQMDTFDLLVDIGLQATSQIMTKTASIPNDEKSSLLQLPQQERYLPHHVIMHYPLEAPRFLSALRWWPAHCPDVTTTATTTTTASSSSMFHKRRKGKPSPTKDTDKPPTSALPRFHVYTFCRMPADTPPSGDDNAHQTTAITEEDVAIDIIANELLPCVGATEPRAMRRAELEQLGCALEVRRVRDVAPGKWVMCVSFSVTSQLLRHMQGDFV